MGESGHGTRGCYDNKPHLLLQHPLLLLDLGKPLEQLANLVIGQLGRALRLRAAAARLPVREDTPRKSVGG